MITVFGYPNSRSIRVVWLLEELQQSYDYQFVNLLQGEHRSAEYLATNPSGKVPAIRDGELLLSESAAINTYLADKHQSDLIPSPGTPLRGLYEQWCQFATSELEQPLWTIGKHSFALPAEKRVAEILPTAEWEFQQALKLLSQGLADKDYILGPRFSAADILLAQILGWGIAFKQPIEQSNLNEYHIRCYEREALIRAREREQRATPQSTGTKD